MAIFMPKKKIYNYIFSFFCFLSQFVAMQQRGWFLYKLGVQVIFFVKNTH